jgi:hypothetical protein
VPGDFTLEAKCQNGNFGVPLYERVGDLERGEVNVDAKFKHANCKPWR